MNVELVAIALAGVGSWLLRGSFVTLGAGRIVPASLDRALAHARPAVLSALLASVVAARVGAAGAVGTASIVAGLAVSVLVAARTRSLPRTLLAGVAVYAIVEWLAAMA